VDFGLSVGIGAFAGGAGKAVGKWLSNYLKDVQDIRNAWAIGGEYVTASRANFLPRVLGPYARMSGERSYTTLGEFFRALVSPKTTSGIPGLSNRLGIPYKMSDIKGIDIGIAEKGEKFFVTSASKWGPASGGGIEIRGTFPSIFPWYWNK